MKHDNVELKNLILPYYTPEDLEVENVLFNEAYAYHFGQGMSQDVVKAVHGYSDALFEGCPEAGVNALHMICTCIMAAAEKNPEAPRVLQEKLQLHINTLIDVFNHPGGWYYEAISFILKLRDDIGDEESCVRGLELLKQLISEKNSFVLAVYERLTK